MRRVNVDEEAAELGALADLMRAERERLKRIQQIAAEQTGAVRREAGRKQKRQQAKASRKRNRR